MEMIQQDNSALIKRIESALDSVRPYLKADHGNVSLIEVTADKIAKVKFEGACSSCSMSAMTFKAGIEETILRMVPEIKAVETIDDLP
ncbi:MAG: NifU family protein [Bacteroidetes bacterium]|jgi:Fe-S cluster biogenesis protein NfuA|nr:NifU family protein [Bacteroidota bacterium]